MDSNHRSKLQQIYSLPPLATREPLHIQFSRNYDFTILARAWPFVKDFFKKTEKFFDFFVFGQKFAKIKENKKKTGAKMISYLKFFKNNY